jgi:hypothetical protein
MKSSESKTEFEPHFNALGKRPCPKDVIKAMINFYIIRRVDDCELDQDGDMLLYQWGTYDWGQGRWFEFNITRQYMHTGGEDEDIFQLSLTLKYSATTELDALLSGNRWCRSPLELDDFLEFISSSEPMQKLSQTPCYNAALEYNQVG